MRVFGDMSLEALASLALGGSSEGGAAGLAARALDTDGDGRSDLVLLDGDGDGTVDGVVRGLDQDGDGLNDTYVTYNEDGSVRSIGRVNETGELDVVYEEPGLFESMLADMGLIELPSPEEALFTSFDDPYFADTYGPWADDLPDQLPDTIVVQPSDVVDLSEAEYLEMADGVSVMEDGPGPDGEANAQSSAESDSADDTPREAAADATSDGGERAENTDTVQSTAAGSTILEVGDTGDGWLYAQVDTNADGVADRRDELQRTVGGWESDVDKDGLKETVAFDADEDGRVDSVDTSGKGDWAGATQAWEVVREPSDIVDDGLYQGDEAAAAAGDVNAGSAAPLDADLDTSAGADATADSDAGSSVDSSVDVDAGGSSDAGASSDPGPADDPA